VTGIAAAAAVVADRMERKVVVKVRSSRKVVVLRRSRYGMVAAEEAGVSVL